MNIIYRPVHLIPVGSCMSPRRGLIIERSDRGFEGVTLVLWVGFGRREFQVDYGNKTVKDTPCYWARLTYRRGEGVGFFRGVSALHYYVLGDA